MCAGAQGRLLQILVGVSGGVGAKEKGPFKGLSRPISLRLRIMNHVYLNNIQDNPHKGRNYWLFVVLQLVQQDHKRHERPLNLGSRYSD